MWWLSKRNRKRGGGEEREKKYLTLLVNRNTNTRDRDIKQGQHQLPRVILQSSYSSSLNQKILMEQLLAHLSQKYIGHSHVVKRSCPPVTSSHSNVFFRKSGGGRKGSQHKMKEEDCLRSIK